MKDTLHLCRAKERFCTAIHRACGLNSAEGLLCLAGPDTMLSRQTLLNCGAYEGLGAGCDGGDVIDVLHFMNRFGLPDESCMT